MAEDAYQCASSAAGRPAEGRGSSERRWCAQRTMLVRDRPLRSRHVRLPRRNLLKLKKNILWHDFCGETVTRFDWHVINSGVFNSSKFMGIEMKILTIAALLLGATLTTGSAVAGINEVTGNVAITSDYRFRGISQSDRDPALQGGFDWAHESGFYLGTWASSVDFGTADSGASGGAIEWDFYGGFSRDINENMSFDVGYMYYYYPSDNWTVNLDYQEFYGSFSFYDASIGVVYSDDYYQSTEEFWYLYGEYSLPLGKHVSLDAHLGYNETSAGFGTNGNYLDWSIAVSTSAVSLDFTLAYVDTDLSDADCFGGTELCGAAGVLTISKSL